MEKFEVLIAIILIIFGVVFLAGAIFPGTLPASILQFIPGIEP